MLSRTKPWLLVVAAPLDWAARQFSTANPGVAMATVEDFGREGWTLEDGRAVAGSRRGQ